MKENLYKKIIDKIKLKKNKRRRIFGNNTISKQLWTELNSPPTPIVIVPVKMFYVIEFFIISFFFFFLNFMFINLSWCLKHLKEFEFILDKSSKPWALLCVRLFYFFRIKINFLSFFLLFVFPQKVNGYYELLNKFMRLLYFLAYSIEIILLNWFEIYLCWQFHIINITYSKPFH